MVVVEEEVGEEVEEVGKREMGDGRKRICERCVYRNYLNTVFYQTR